MNAQKHLAVASFCLLTACAPPPTTEMMPELSPIPDTNQISDNNTRLSSHASDKTIPATAERLAQTKTVNQTGENKRTNTAATRVSSWDVRGSMAAKNKSKGWSATMNWIQRGPSTYQIRLMGPLGGGTVLISRSGGVVTLKDGPKTASSSNAEELLLKQTGIRLPVSNLYYWVRGLPAPGSIQGEERDSANHLLRLKQNGYTINFTQYTAVKGVHLPSMIQLNGNGLMIKVRIRSWTI